MWGRLGGNIDFDEAAIEAQSESSKWVGWLTSSVEGLVDVTGTLGEVQLKIANWLASSSS